MEKEKKKLVNAAVFEDYTDREVNLYIAKRIIEQLENIEGVCNGINAELIRCGNCLRNIEENTRKTEQNQLYSQSLIQDANQLTKDIANCAPVIQNTVLRLFQRLEDERQC